MICADTLLSSREPAEGKRVMSEYLPCVAMTVGRREYEADIVRRPNYHDGTSRPTWAGLREIARWSWERPQGQMSPDAKAEGQ